MTKKDSDKIKNYSNVKPMQIDPLGERLSRVGMAGGASKKSSSLKIMDAKPLIKKLKSVIDKRRSDTRKYRKDRAKKDSPALNRLNKAQERLETADEFRAGVIGVMKKKLPKEGLKMIKDPFDRVLKSRSRIRTALMSPDKLKGKKDN